MKNTPISVIGIVIGIVPFDSITLRRWCVNQPIGVHSANALITLVVLHSIQSHWVQTNPLHYRFRPIKEVQFRFAYFLSHFIRIQIFQIVTWFIFSPCKNQPYEFVGTKSGSESSQKVQKCQFWEFLKWETAAYLWTFFTFKNPIEPHKPIVHWEGIVVLCIVLCIVVLCN